MSQLLRTVVVPFLALAAFLPAQEGEKAKPADAKPLAKEQPQGKEDAITMNDVAIKAITQQIANTKVDKSSNAWRLSLPKPDKVEFDATHDYFWHMETELGVLKIKLHADTAPVHVASCIYLARLGYYDGLTFHRVIPGFMAQGACPEGSGRGGPGYQFSGEFGGNKKHDKPGILSMANAGPGTDGSQFFLTFRETPHLDGRHTVWGEVADGTPVLKALEGKGTQVNNGMLQKDKQIKIVRTWVSVGDKSKADAPKTDKPKEEKKEPGK